jgi:HlyD family secretion protein
MVTPIRGDSPMDTPLAPRRRRWWPLALGAAAALAVVALFAAPLVRRWLSADQVVDLARLRLGTVTRGDLIHDVAAQGRVVAASRPTLFSPAAGIVSLRVKEGETVAAGQLLAQVASPELDNRRQQEQAGLDSLRSELGRLEISVRQQGLADRQGVEVAEMQRQAAAREVERAEKLSGMGLLNKVDFEKAHDDLALRTLELKQAQQKVDDDREMLDFQLTDARARLERQQLVLRDVERQVGELAIKAPFAGQVATLSVADADAVVRGQPLVGVVDLSDLEVEVAIPESYADEVAPGVPAMIHLDAGDVPGTLTSVAPEVHDGQVSGRVAFAKGVPAGLRQNQRLSARLILDRRQDVLKVPRGPFLEAGGGRAVYVVADGVARRRKATFGAVSVTEVEVVDGLAAGDQIVLSDTSDFDGADSVLIRP